MRYALMTEPQQGLSYDEILAVARTAEEAGLEAFFRSDHYASFPGGAGLPTTDAWTTLAGLARETTTIRLGVLVSPVTFRLPGNLAKVIQTVDEMSDGRVEAGFGAGWNDDEHAQLGLPFPAARRALRHARGADGDHPRPVDRAGRLVVRRRALAGSRVEAPRRDRPRRSAPSAHHLRRQGRAAPGAAGRPVRRRVQPQLRRRRTTPRRPTPASAPHAPDDRRDPDELVLFRDDRRAWLPRPRATSEARVADLLAALGQRRADQRGVAGRSPPAAGSWARRSRRCERVRALEASRDAADHAPGLRAARSRPRPADGDASSPPDGA